MCVCFLCLMNHRDPDAHLVVPPETCQPIWINHPEHQTILVFPSNVFLVTLVAQQLIHIVPQQSALWQWLKQQQCTFLSKNYSMSVNKLMQNYLGCDHWLCEVGSSASLYWTDWEALGWCSLFGKDTELYSGAMWRQLLIHLRLRESEKDIIVNNPPLQNSIFMV